MKIESQIDDLRRYKDSIHLAALLVSVEQLLGAQHLLVAILRSIFAYDMTGVIGMSERFFSQSIKDTLVSMSEAKSMVHGIVESTTSSVGAASVTAAGLAAGALAAAATSTAIVPKELGKAAASSAAKSAAQNGLKYNPFGPDVFIETGKVVGQNSTRLAGNVIVGVSAAFLVWDAIDLGFNIADLVSDNDWLLMTSLDLYQPIKSLNFRINKFISGYTAGTTILIVGKLQIGIPTRFPST